MLLDQTEKWSADRKFGRSAGGRALQGSSDAFRPPHLGFGGQVALTPVSLGYTFRNVHRQLALNTGNQIDQRALVVVGVAHGATLSQLDCGRDGDSATWDVRFKRRFAHGA